MITASLALTLAVLGATPAELEEQVLRATALQFERVGRRTPARDDALSSAARALAQVALDENARAAADLVTVTEAISLAGGWDASPRALVIRGAPVTEPLRSIESRRDLSSDPATHVGVGVATRGTTAAVVLLLAQRRMTVKPFDRRHDGPTSPRALCGRLEAPLSRPELFITLPDGRVEKLGASKEGRDGFCAKIPLGAPGRHTVEVLGRGPKGPEVAALFFVDVGPPPVRADSPLGEEPTDPDLARVQVLDRINALRAAHGLQPLSFDPAVTRVAQAYSDQMAKENFFAHVSPDGGTVGQRLRAAGYPFKGAGENLGLASGPLAAHFGLEHSPGHRKNLLEPQWTKVGLGLAEQRSASGGRLVVLTQVFVEPSRDSADPVGDAYAVLGARRQALSLPPLRRSPELEALARAHARRALDAGEPKADLPDAKLHERVFATLDDVKAASVDFFVADSPALVEASKATGQPDNHYVGIGAVQGDTARYGRGKYWVVVIYAARR